VRHNRDISKVHDFHVLGDQAAVEHGGSLSDVHRGERSDKLACEGPVNPVIPVGGVDDDFEVGRNIEDFFCGVADGSAPGDVAINVQRAVGRRVVEHDVATFIQIDVVGPEFASRDMQRGACRNLDHAVGFASNQGCGLVVVVENQVARVLERGEVERSREHLVEFVHGVVRHFATNEVPVRSRLVGNRGVAVEVDAVVDGDAAITILEVDGSSRVEGADVVVVADNQRVVDVSLVARAGEVAVAAVNLDAVHVLSVHESRDTVDARDGVDNRFNLARRIVISKERIGFAVFEDAVLVQVFFAVNNAAVIGVGVVFSAEAVAIDVGERFVDDVISESVGLAERVRKDFFAVLHEVVVRVVVVDHGVEAVVFVEVINAVAVGVTRDRRVGVLSLRHVGRNPSATDVNLVFVGEPLVGTVVVDVDEAVFDLADIRVKASCVNSHHVAILPDIDRRASCEGGVQSGFVRATVDKVQVGVGDVEGNRQSFFDSGYRTLACRAVREGIENRITELVQDAHLDFVLSDVATVVVVQHDSANNPVSRDFFFVRVLFGSVGERELMEAVVAGREVVRSAALLLVEELAPLEVEQVRVLTCGERIHMEVVDNAFVREHAGIDGESEEVGLACNQEFRSGEVVVGRGGFDSPLVGAGIEMHRNVRLGRDDVCDNFVRVIVNHGNGVLLGVLNGEPREHHVFTVEERNDRAVGKSLEVRISEPFNGLRDFLGVEEPPLLRRFRHDAVEVAGLVDAAVEREVRSVGGQEVVGVQVGIGGLDRCGVRALLTPSEVVDRFVFGVKDNEFAFHAEFEVFSDNLNVGGGALHGVRLADHQLLALGEVAGESDGVVACVADGEALEGVAGCVEVGNFNPCGAVCRGFGLQSDETRSGRSRDNRAYDAVGLAVDIDRDVFIGNEAVGIRIAQASGLVERLPVGIVDTDAHSGIVREYARSEGRDVDVDFDLLTFCVLGNGCRRDIVRLNVQRTAFFFLHIIYQSDIIECLVGAVDNAQSQSDLAIVHHLFIVCFDVDSRLGEYEGAEQ